MSTNPKISIVVHSYNRERYIAETIESVLSQGYPNLELIVIDDNSSDKSWEIIQTYKDQISYMEKLDGKRDSPTMALNIGFSHTTGEIMYWLNTKNILLPGSLRTVAEIFRRENRIEWLTGLGTLIDEKGLVVKVVPLKKNIYDFLIGNWAAIQQESTFWKRSLWKKTGEKIPDKYPWSFDAALWTKFFSKTELFHINMSLGAYRRISQSQSTNINSRNLFRKSTMNILSDFKKDATRDVSTQAFLYRIIRYFKFILQFIPDNIYMGIPVFKKFNYAAIYYKEKNGEVTIKHGRENPFNPRPRKNT